MSADGRDETATPDQVATLRPQILRFCRAHLGHADYRHTSAEDLTQEVLLSAVAALPGYRGDADGLLRFVYGIARHKLVDCHRERGRDRSLPCDEVAERPERTPDPAQEALRAARDGGGGGREGGGAAPQREVCVE
jgi:RNA polymerase sigma-70 factor, ECF subfamily